MRSWVRNPSVNPTTAQHQLHNSVKEQRACFRHPPPPHRLMYAGSDAEPVKQGHFKLPLLCCAHVHEVCARICCIREHIVAREAEGSRQNQCFLQTRKREALTCHPAVEDLCRAPDQALVVLCNDALRHGPVDVVKLVSAARVLQKRKRALSAISCAVLRKRLVFMKSQRCAAPWPS